ncbi:hypothetical protein ANN_15783 [Periplaneta americana]|uniref:Uncharacterized protein n=1 Tax=Periplaneta americana TaxID=6978 RepID=A0ABQ8SH71_PERAM|nr:hypothetical protein ANN_15783 [Periplaneta americana]
MAGICEGGNEPPASLKENDSRNAVPGQHSLAKRMQFFTQTSFDLGENRAHDHQFHARVFIFMQGSHTALIRADACMPGQSPPCNLKIDLIWITCVPAARLRGADRQPARLSREQGLRFWAGHTRKLPDQTPLHGYIRIFIP